MTALTLFGLIAAHFVGDYLLQSGWMANEKTKRWWPAIAHGLVYTIPFLFVTQSPLALFVIASTHIIIDHYRLAKYVVFAKEFIAPKSFHPTWADAKDNFGYPSAVPAWLSGWLLFIADNTMHFLINAAAVVWL